MIEILQFGGVEVHYTDKEFTVDNVIYPAESYIIFISQPCGRYAKDLLEEQFYPDLRKNRKDPPIRPFDAAGWTLPYVIGIKCFQIDKPFSLNATLLDNPNYPEEKVISFKGKYFIP